MRGLRVAILSGTFIAIGVLVGFCVKAGNSNCLYAGNAYKDGDKGVHGGTCQQCNQGLWVDRQSGPCSDCDSHSVPAAESASGDDKDCIYDGQRFSDGAVHVHSGKCWQCNAGNWLAREPARCEECR
jgi:hypothetical protein